MVVKREVAHGVFRGLREFWKCDELKDFSVTLGSVQFGCHRLLLAACSDFFRGLFRSGLQEMEQKSVTIKDISSQTFELIMESIYTGHDVLTKGNVIPIWRAAHQLQIQFMISECENFVLDKLSIENFAEYFYIGNTLNSDIVMETLWPFVLKNCNSFFQTNYFLELSMVDVLTMINSQHLETKSEDDVIHAILKWVEFQETQIQPKFSCVTGNGITGSDKIDQSMDNGVGSGEPLRKKCKTSQDISTVGSNRAFLTDSIDESNNQGDGTNKDVSCKNLTILLSYARTCLASEKCLQMLNNHPLVRDQKEARDIVIGSLLYRLQVGKRNGHWPSRAVHRHNSRSLHCIVTELKIGNNIVFNAYSVERNKWSEMKIFSSNMKVNFAGIDNELYAVCIDLSEKYSAIPLLDLLLPRKRLFVLQFKNGTWSNVNISLTLRSDDFKVAVVDSFLYILSAHDKTVWQLDLATEQVTRMSSLSGNKAISYVMVHDQSILVCYDLTVEGGDKTVIQRYDTYQNTWTRLNILDGPANGMTSFKDDHFTYLLQSKGKLWKVVKRQEDSLEFELVVKLWNCNWPLHGAVVFLNELHIFGARFESLQNDVQFMKSLPGVFREIRYHEITSANNSDFTPFIIDKRDFYMNLLSPSCVNSFHKHL